MDLEPMRESSGCISWHTYEDLQNTPAAIGRFLTHARHGSTYQDPQWYLHTEASTSRFAVIAALREGQPVFASLIRKSWVPGTTFYVGTVERGPVFEDIALAVELWDDYEAQLIRSRLCAIEIHPFWERLEAQPLRNHLQGRGYAFSPPNSHIETLTLDLIPSEETIFNSLKSSRRNLIRKALKMGISVRPVRGPSEMEKFWEMYRDMCLSKGINFWSRSRFERIRRYSEAFPGQCTCLLGWLDRDLIGGNIILRHADVAEVTRGGGSTRINNSVPKTDLILWESIRWAKQAGAATYDFGGYKPDAQAGSPEWGVNRFKLEFTTHQVSLLEPMQKIFYPSLYGIFSSLRKIKKAVTKHLPLRVTE